MYITTETVTVPLINHLKNLKNVQFESSALSISMEISETVSFLHQAKAHLAF